MVTETSIESPDSIPSMAETSVGSSLYEGDVEDVPPRRLFYHGDTTETPFTLGTLYPSNSGEEMNTEVAYGSEVSITSSETTVVPSWNLTMKESQDAIDPFSTCDDEMYLDHTLNEEHDEPFPERRCPEMIMEEPPEESTSCHGPLTSGQLAELLVAFQARKMWTSRPKDDTHILPLETPREDLLLRQCAALKKILRDDSVKIVNLRRALETQEEMNTVKDIEIEDKEVELQIAMDRIDALKREKELMREREDELMNTIKILKMEVDKLSTWECKKNDMTEGQVLCRNSEHHISQMPQKEESQSSVLPELRSELDTKVQENGQLHTEATNVKASQETSKCRDDDDPCPPIQSSSTELAALSAALQGIIKRLEAIEKNKLMVVPESTPLEACEGTNDKRGEIQETLQIERSGVMTENLLKISQDPDEVEVLLSKDKKIKDQVDSPCRKSVCCWDSWSLGDIE